MFLFMLIFSFAFSWAEDTVIREGNPNCNCVAITFDLCPVRSGSGFRPEILDYLNRNQIEATFFMSGRWIESHVPETTAIVNNPLFEVGVHGHEHAHMNKVSEAEQLQEIYLPLDILKNRFGYTTELFRPPFGDYSDLTLKLVAQAGLKFIFWSFESGDPDPKLSVERIVNGLKAQTRSGSILIFHANGNGVRTPEIIPRLYQEILQPLNLRPVKVSQILKP